MSGAAPDARGPKRPSVAPPHPATLPLAQLLGECRRTNTRRSGPGGQHRNKVATAVVLAHEPTGIDAEAAERRSQEQNRQMALQRLRLRLAVRVRAPGDPGQLAARGKPYGGRALRIAPTNDDFAAVLALALDVIAEDRGDLQRAAAALRTSASQVVRLLRLHPPALQTVNELRRGRGAAPLR